MLPNITSLLVGIFIFVVSLLQFAMRSSPLIITTSLVKLERQFKDDPYDDSNTYGLAVMLYFFQMLYSMLSIAVAVMGMRLRKK